MGLARDMARRAKAAAPALAHVSAQVRTAAIDSVAEAIGAAGATIVEANSRDMVRARAAGMSESLLDRLLLDDGRVASLVSSTHEVARQEDPVGRVVGGGVLDSGIRMEQVTVPLGVVAIIYEARPNVTADAAALCLRSGNACVLRGGSAAVETCRAIVAAIRSGLALAGLPKDLVCLLDSEGHGDAEELMRANGLVDLLVPRGGAALIKACVAGATVPVVETGVGNCHIYLHESASANMARDIVVNAKTSRPGVCNAAESLLVDATAAERLLPPVLAGLDSHGVALVGDDLACEVAGRCGVSMDPATEDDWGREYLGLEMSVACVSGVDEAVAWINRYGTGHSEAIVSSAYEASERFLAGVDAAAVYVNASTRFTDGGMFGLGAEIGISTQKLHVRGPMGASALTTTKYLLRGEGQVR